MTSDPKVAVIVVSYNTRKLLLECLDSVIGVSEDKEIDVVVVDNASADGSYEAVRQAFPNVVVIRNSTNVGFGAACNQGIMNTRAPYLLLLNSDAKLTTGAYKVLCACLESNALCGAAGCRLVDPAGAELVNTRNFLTPLNQVLELMGFSGGNRLFQRTHRPGTDNHRVDCTIDWIDAACLLLRREALDKVGLFDEQFFMYSEDEDLCYRLRKAGWQVCFCGTGVAIHHGAASSQLQRAEMLRHFYQSQMLFLSKHRSHASALVYAIAMRMVLLLKHLLLRDGQRRETALEQLKALKQAWASRNVQSMSS